MSSRRRARGGGGGDGELYQLVDTTLWKRQKRWSRPTNGTANATENLPSAGVPGEQVHTPQASAPQAGATVNIQAVAATQTAQLHPQQNTGAAVGNAELMAPSADGCTQFAAKAAMERADEENTAASSSSRSMGQVLGKLLARQAAAATENEEGAIVGAQHRGEDGGDGEHYPKNGAGPPASSSSSATEVAPETMPTISTTAKAIREAGGFLSKQSTRIKAVPGSASSGSMASSSTIGADKLVTGAAMSFTDSSSSRAKASTADLKTAARRRNDAWDQQLFKDGSAEDAEHFADGATSARAVASPAGARRVEAKGGSSSREGAGASCCSGGESPGSSIGSPGNNIYGSQSPLLGSIVTTSFAVRKQMRADDGADAGASAPAAGLGGAAASSSASIAAATEASLKPSTSAPLAVSGTCLVCADEMDGRSTAAMPCCSGFACLNCLRECVQRREIRKNCLFCQTPWSKAFMEAVIARAKHEERRDESLKRGGCATKMQGLGQMQLLMKARAQTRPPAAEERKRGTHRPAKSSK